MNFNSFCQKTLQVAAVFFVSFLLSHPLSAQTAIDLAGEWQFQIDREGKGEQEGWYKDAYQMEDKILLPASMPQRLKGDDISVNTKWVGSLYDSSYFFNPYMKKYRNPGKDMKLQFFLTPDKHYVGKAWYKRTVVLPETEELPMYTLYLERPHIATAIWVNGEKVEPIIRVNPGQIVTRASTEIFTINPPWMSDALVFITKNVHRGISASDVYRHVNRSHTVVDQAFRDALGSTVSKEIAATRMKEAHRLVTSTNLPFAMISKLSGFASIQYFTRSFTATYGRSPLKVRDKANPSEKLR